VLQELRELKDLMKSLKAKQGEMEKTLARITKQLYGGPGVPRTFLFMKSNFNLISILISI
jgi:hypothetical protein